MNTLLLVRHGQSEWNLEGKIQGQQDSPLTPLGVTQAAAVGACLSLHLRDVSFTMYASPLSRARETAFIIADKLQRAPSDVIVDERLNDFNLGDITGTRGWDEVARRYPEIAWHRLNDPYRFHPPNGESGADVAARLRAFLAEIDAGSVTLIVCHGVINKFIRSIRRDITGADIIALDESQSAVYKLEGARESVIKATLP